MRWDLETVMRALPALHALLVPISHSVATAFWVHAIAEYVDWPDVVHQGGQNASQECC